MNLELVGKPDWTALPADFFKGVHDFAGIQCNSYVRSPDACLYVDTICFSCLSGVANKGDEVGIMVTENTMRRRVNQPALELFRRAFNLYSQENIADRWREEAKLIWPETAQKNAWTTFKSKTGKYNEVLGKATFLDFSQRYPSMLFAYLKLRERLPNENPWFLFQVSHFLPASLWAYGMRSAIAEEHEDKVAAVYGLAADSTVHSLGGLSGMFSLQPTFEQAVKDGVEGCLNDGFFPRGKERYPDPKWTWDQFAEWTSGFISKEKELM